MRVLALPLILLSLAAACGGGSNPGTTPTTSPVSTATPVATSHAVLPFTPVEEVLTPPPDIDTSGWLTYQDAEHGFELKYPPDAQVRRNISRAGPGATGVGTEISLPFEPGTTLEEKYMFIKIAATPPETCLPAELTSPGKPGATPDVNMVMGDGANFWRTHSFGGGMMQGFSVTTYMTARGTSCVTIDAVLYGISSGAPVDTPLPPSDDQKESEIFTAIIATFRWLDQP